MRKAKNTTGKNIAALLLLPLMMALASVPVHASLIQIDFTATISNDGGTTTDDISGQFILDTDVLFAVDAGAVDGVITSGSATLFGSTETLDPVSAFTFASAATRPGYGVLTLIGDYGPCTFALDLASSLFFTSANAFDDLTDALLLGNLLDFVPDEALGTTRFAHFVDNLEEWEGALTSLTIAAVPEPAILWLFMLAAPALAFWRCRTRA